MNPSILNRLHRLKVLFVGAVLIIGGLALRLSADALGFDNEIVESILLALADALVVSGGIGLAIDYFTGKERDAANLAATRATLRELTPDFTDAVVKGFAVTPADLRRVATPELLDSLAINAMGLRLGDSDFAREIYEDVRDQAIHALERWYDAHVSIRLRDATEGSGVRMFEVLIRWEYTVLPSGPMRRFACTSDRDEFHELVTDVPATSTWFMTPRPGFVAREKSAFELLEFAVDGEVQPIRRSERKSGQVYSVRLKNEHLLPGKPVRMSHLYRTITPQSGHRLFLEITQPTRGFSLDLDYTDTDIAHLSVTDLITSPHRPRVSRLPDSTEAKVLSVDLPGWMLPRAGFSFVWTLASEERSTVRGSKSGGARSKAEAAEAA